MIFTSEYVELDKPMVCVCAHNVNNKNVVLDTF